MKVLFAVSNDNITTSVVKKYQQKYKEIITNKNVYYFNAIVKELQKDKTYDSIVIEEDLEPISNNNYDAIDKFLTEKLDSISDEAAKPTGEDIPIIFICADRRTVSDKLLIKLFSMGIYNALIGNDRSLEKLCELIAKPRSKKDAKKYYRIDIDKAEYQSNKDEIVSEEQIQNILNYYKKIGTNERKCVQAFDSISKQYDSTQLRIIVKFLPMDIKAILEARSPVYQRLMSNGTVLSNGQYNAYTPNNPSKPEKLGFVSKDLNTSAAKPRSVVIPTNMKVQERNEQPEDNSNSGYNSQYGMNQQRTNQTYGQYNSNQYGTQSGMGQYANQYYQMRQNPYGNMYGQMQNNNPYGMGNTMGQQMNVNRMQQRTGYINYQSGYGMNNNYQQNINQQATQNQFNQKSGYIANNNVQQNQQGGFNQNNTNGQQIYNNQTDNNAVQNNNQEQKNNTIPKNVQPIEEITTEQPKTDRVQATNTVQTQQIQQPKNSIDNSQESDINLSQVQNDLITQAGESLDRENNNQLINLDDNTSLIKQEEEKSLIEKDKKVENSDGSLQALPIEELQNSSNEQEIVEPIKRRRGRPKKNRTAEEIVPQAKKRRGRPRKISITEEERTEENTIQEIADIEPIKIEDNGAIVKKEQEDDVSLNNLTLHKNNTDVSSTNNNTSLNNEDSNYNISKNDEIKPINLYDLDIESEDLFGDNQNIDLGIKPLEELKIDKEPTQNTTINQLKQNHIPQASSYMSENTDLISEQKKNNDYDISSPIAGNGKIVAFVGTSKNGTSFIVNNVALLLANSGINTAIVDLTINKNSYYMFTDNDAGKTKIAIESLNKLSEGIVQGLKVKNNLTVFTSLPENHEDDIINPRTVLESLINRFDVILLDCDFNTHEAYFAFANELFLTQSMDAFTIQPLTKFLSDLKLKNILDENKLRIIINKYVKLKKLDAKMIVGGMSKYNEPSMTLQRDLFDPKKVSVITLPFDNQTYTKYLESIALCQVSVNGYSKEVVNGLEKIKNLVYPLVAGSGRGYENSSNYTNINNMDYNNQRNSQGFSNNMNDTLNRMRSNNF